MDSLIIYCKTIHPISENLEAALIKHSKVKEYKSGEFILKQGMIANHACFVVSGLARSFYLKGSEEVTTKFFKRIISHYFYL